VSNLVEQAIALIDDINQHDPKQELEGEQLYPAALLYGQRMSYRLSLFSEASPISLEIAVRAQHIKRWTVPRDTHPLGREGYLAWRKSLSVMHADQAMRIAKQVGCDEATILDIGKMLRKEKIKRDPLVQTLEDVACLVFLEFYFTEFCKKHTPEKIISIVKKTWHKMSKDGQEAALKLPFSAPQLELIGRALA
jgi:hypothetical protein